MGNSLKPFKKQHPSFDYQPLTIPLVSVEAQNENLRVFSFAELKKATKRFTQDRVVEHENGSVRIFSKGYIDETTSAPSRTGTTIAVSVVECYSLRSVQDCMAVVRFLEQISHPNLVKLLGYCCEDNEKSLLVFEYFHKGCLDHHLYGEKEALSWEIRVKIAIGTAQGLAFLHSTINSPLHLGVRMRHIMLDEQYNAKLFHLESSQPDLLDRRTVFSEMEYVTPEFVLGYLGLETDVYTFGVILLKLFTGSKDTITNLNKQSLGVRTRSFLPDNYKIGEIIDPRLGSNYPVDSATKMGTLIQGCTKQDRKKRPSMQQVLDVLNSIAEN